LKRFDSLGLQHAQRWNRGALHADLRALRVAVEASAQRHALDVTKLKHHVVEVLRPPPEPGWFPTRRSLAQAGVHCRLFHAADVDPRTGACLSLCLTRSSVLMEDTGKHVRLAVAARSAKGLALAAARRRGSSVRLVRAHGLVSSFSPHQGYEFSGLFRVRYSGALSWFNFQLERVEPRGKCVPLRNLNP